MTTSINNDGIQIPAQDLGSIAPDNSDDGRLFHHDGASQITLTDGRTTTEAGYYRWDNSVDGWSEVSGNVSGEDIAPASVSTKEQPNIQTVHLDGRDPQTVVDSVEPWTKIVGDPTNQHTLASPLTVTTTGVQLERLNLTIEDGAECDCIEFRADHGRVRNCRLDGNRANQSSGVAGVEDANGVTVTDCTDVIVEGNHITQMRAQGILVSSYHDGNGGPVSHVRVRDNTIEGVWNGGILLAGGGGNAATFGWVENNEVRNFKNEGLQAIDGFQNAWFVDNDVRGPSPGLTIENHSGRNVDRPLKNVTYRGNHVVVTGDSGRGTHAFRVQHAGQSFENITLENNYLEALSTGVRFTNGQITDFNVINNHIVSDGVGITTWDNPVSDVTIKDNLVEVNNTQGISRIVNEAGNITENMKVMGNTVRGSSDAAIILQDTPGAVIEDNQIEEATNRGIVIKSDQGGSGTENIYGVKVRGNHIEESTASDGTSALGIETLQDSGTLDYYIIRENTINVNGTAVNDNVGGANAAVGTNPAW